MGELAVLMSALGATMAAGDLALVPLREEHRVALKAACAEDAAIWAIYPSDWGPAGFDANFDAVLASPTRTPLATMVDGALAGMTSFIAHDPDRQIVEIGGTYLRPAMRGTGLNRRVKRLMLDRAFASGIRRVEFRIDDRNGRSKAALAGIGGVLEGVMRAERITWTGHVRDTALFSILKEEWT